MKKRVIIALGGNAILNKGDDGTFEQQYKNVYVTMEKIYGLICDDRYEVVITHGNGPQVGSILIQNAAGKNQVPAMPMYVCGAMSQGQIGLLIQQSLGNIMLKKNDKRSVATIVTQVEVNPEDPSFKNPSKPVGPFYSKEEADKLAEETGHIIKEDAGRGYRRVVPSPKPTKILELEAVKDLIESENVVIAGGGGGIPVVVQNGRIRGVDAVIDKDRLAALMGDNLNADILIILTAVEKVALDFGKENEKFLSQMTVSEAKGYLAQGHFAPGSMRPKIEAIIEFIEKDPKRMALVTHPSKLLDAMDHKNGTWIVA